VDEPLSVKNGSNTYFYLADGLGTIQRLVKKNITPASATAEIPSASSPWGDMFSSSIGNRYGFTGREYDYQTGLYYYRARYYDPQQGRFISEDPIGFGGGGNFYAYAGNSPINLTDPSGLKLVVGPLATQEQISAFNAGMAEVLTRLRDSDCKKIFCKKIPDPERLLNDKEYRFGPLDDVEAGAQVYPNGNVTLNTNGPYFTAKPFLFVPSHRRDVESRTLVEFPSLEAKRAFLLLHELGHQSGAFGPDQTKFINGTHSIKVLERCFKDAKIHLQ
jgi:RHS repeat-associated protein